MSDTCSMDTEHRIMLQDTLKAIESMTGVMNAFISEDNDVLLQLERLKGQMIQLERRRRSIKDNIETTRCAKEKMETIAQNLRCSLSLMRNLPTELLIQIFKVAIEDAVAARRSDLSSAFFTNHPDRTSLHLAQVCSRWRQIFANTPELWSYIVLSAKHDNEEEERAAEIHRFHRAASSGLPAQRSLFISFSSLFQQQFIAETLGEQPIPYKELEIHCTDTLGGGGWILQALRAQEVTIYHDTEPTAVNCCFPLIQLASKVSIYGALPTWGTQPWAFLRVLCVRGFDEPNFFWNVDRDFLVNLLNSAPFLVALELDLNVLESFDVWESTINKTHSHLETLSIHFNYFAGGQGLFGVTLDLPRLRKFEFLSIHCHTATKCNNEFICRLPNVSRLGLPMIKSDEVTLTAELLRWQPNVERLELTGRNLDNMLTFINAAYHSIPPTVTPLPLPKLTTLHIEDTDIQGSTLLELVRVKLEHERVGGDGVSAMECIEMYNSPGVSLSDWAKIQRLLEEGRTANGVSSTSD